MRFLLLLAVLASAAQAQPVTVRPDVTPHPWTDKPFQDRDFQFAVVSDRNGGMSPGVFERGVAALNLLRPEFVISVGDLIDGYTESPEVWTREWDEFDAIVDRLDAPFFYVPGNHDISNAALAAAWRERHGPSHYHFVYKDVLFVAVDTEERWPDGGITEAQVESVRQALAENPDVRWTLLFMHRPLFAYGDQAGFDKIDVLLQGRRHTVFAGHHHHYLALVRGGEDYVTLATTGGGNDGRGADFGEFDGVTWVTMTPDGPVIANLELDGIHDKNLVDEAAYRFVQPLRMGTWLATEPVLSATSIVSRLTAVLVLANTSDRPMSVLGDLAPSGLVQLEPNAIGMTIAPGETLRLPITLFADGEQTVEAIAEAGVSVTLSAAFTRDDGVVLSLPATREIALDWTHVLPVRPTPVRLDDTLDEWDRDAMLRAYRPGFFQEGWDWHGPDDGWFRFAAEAQDDRLVVAIEAFDDVFVRGTTIADKQDKLIVILDREGADPLRVEVAPGDHPEAPLMSVSDPTVRVRAACRRTVTGLEAEISLPRPSGPFRLNVGQMDHDRPENTKPSVLWWRPLATAGAPGGAPFVQP